MTTVKSLIAMICTCILSGTLHASETAAVYMTIANAPGSDMDSVFHEPSHIINFNVYEQNEMVYCNFRTEFACHSYAIEGKQSENEEFRSLFYCKDKLCVDSREWVDISFQNNEYPYRYFRIKTTLENGSIHYSQVVFVQAKASNDVEIVNSVVSGYLYFRFNSAKQAPAFKFSIAGINGEIIKNDEPAADGCVDLEALPAGFYIISFKSGNDKIYHYKFLKTGNL